MELPVPEGFWEPLRKTVLGNFLGNVESRNSDHDAGRKPVVTYVSRQSAGRRLTTEAHEGLVDALKQLEEEGLCDVRIPVMEHMTLKEQIELASSTTVSGYPHLRYIYYNKTGCRSWWASTGTD